ncbi:unnamed protein product [Cochlearia groenlandica]
MSIVIQQRVYASILLMMVVMLSTSQNTNGNNNNGIGVIDELGPMPDKGLLPNPISCVADARKIPNCVKSVKHFHFKEIKKECCIVLLGLPEDCFGILFPMRFTYRVMLKITCKIIGIGG